MRQQIKDLLPTLPRPSNEKGLFGAQKAMYRALQPKPHVNTCVFLSYRSTDLLDASATRGNEVTDLDDLQQDLARKIGEKLEQLQGNAAAGRYPSVQPGTEVRFVPPGQLAYPNEVLSEYRRWQVLTTIDTMWISEVDEVWIYDTKNYLDSWWTQGELASLSWRFVDGPYCPKMRIFHPKSNTLTNIPADFLLPMTKEQRKTMVRIMSVADPRTTAPEYIRALHGNSSFPVAGQVPYTSGHQWSDAFWLNPILTCNCQRKDAATIRSKAGIEAFLHIANEPRLTPKEWENSIKHGAVTCSSCKSNYRLKEVHPRYLWMPTRKGKPTGPGGTSLIKLPTYRVVHL